MSYDTGTAITLSREVTALQIPSGTPLQLEAGTEVLITQTLGGTVTVMVPAFGGLFRIQGKDLDALGMDVQTQEIPDGPATEEQIWGQLRTCFDPEIPVNIVDLGLIYDMTMTPLPSGKARVDVAMTLTAMGCGMGPTIAGDAEMKILSLPGVEEASVRVVWDPPWGPERISEEGKKTLGII